MGRLKDKEAANKIQSVFNELKIHPNSIPSSVDPIWAKCSELLKSNGLNRNPYSLYVRATRLRKETIYEPAKTMSVEEYYSCVNATKKTMKSGWTDIMFDKLNDPEKYLCVWQFQESHLLESEEDFSFKAYCNFCSSNINGNVVFYTAEKIDVSLIRNESHDQCKTVRKNAT